MWNVICCAKIVQDDSGKVGVMIADQVYELGSSNGYIAKDNDAGDVQIVEQG